ncbi:MAG: ACP S-malonyltransferase [Spirochaetales bacterium]|nr:ACP S-malonyltransferase [Spirochaetales bacterium]
MMKAFVFPGQGSQVKGMGGELFDLYQDLVSKADAILGYSVKDLCLNDTMNQLGQTQFTQPALYIVCALMYLEKIKKTGTLPDFVAGHSVGEYSALFAAGVYDFETGLKIIEYRGRLMSEAENGAMAAVIGLNASQIEKILSDNSLTAIDIANYNSAGQIVISGLRQDIEAAKPVFENSGAMLYIILNVSGAFHSRYMKNAGEKFNSFIEQFSFNEPEIKVIANVNARPYESNSVKENLSRQIVSSVYWLESVMYMMEQGVTEFEEIGPGNVLTRLIQKIKRGS